MLDLIRVGRAAFAAVLLGATCVQAQPATGGVEAGEPGAAPVPTTADAAQSAAESASAEPNAGSAPAASAALSPEQRLGQWLQSQVDAQGRPCPAPVLTRVGDLYYVACGEAGLWTIKAFETGFSMLGRQTLNGRAVGFSMTPDGQLYVRVAAQTAGAPETLVPVGETPAAPAPPAANAPAGNPSPGPAALAQAGRVTALEDGIATINLGVEHGLRRDGRVLFAAPDDGTAEREDVIGIVTSVGPGSSRVVLGLNEWVEVGDPAQPTTDRQTESVVAPIQSRATWDMALMIRPFLTMEDLGAGMTLDAQVGMHPIAPLHVALRLSPAGFASGKDGGVSGYRLYGIASFDHRLFAGGLGVGASTVNLNARDAKAVPLLVQELRLGSVDGLHLRFTTGIVVNNDQFEFSSLRVHTQSPLGRGVALVVAGGFGTEGVGNLDVGVRSRLRGNGDVESLFLTVTLGVSGVTEDYYDNDYRGAYNNATYVGPHVGLGLEYRL